MNEKTLPGISGGVNETNDQVDHIIFWNSVLDQLGSKLSKPSFDTWFSNTTLAPFNHDDRKLMIEVPNEFARDWLEGRYESLVSKTVHDVTGKEYHIEFIENPNLALRNQYEPTTIIRNEAVENKLDEILAELKQLNQRVSALESGEK